MPDTPSSGSSDQNPSSSQSESTLDSRTAALAAAIREIEQHVAGSGWDQPARLYALVVTADAIAADPDLRDRFPQDVVQAAASDPHHLLSIEQEGFGTGDGLEEDLGRIAWPSTVAGAALVVERIMVPPSAEEGLPSDPDQALRILAEHPQRQDVRIAVGVLRTGPRWSSLRYRAHDDASAVAHGPDLVPGLAQALATTLED